MSSRPALNRDWQSVKVTSKTQGEPFAAILNIRNGWSRPSVYFENTLMMATV